MNILALDTSGETASVAILRDETVLGEIFLDLGRNHSEILLPSIEHLLTATGLELMAIDVFACTVGPGSFTGIRIGVGTIKGLALAADRPVVGLSALEVLAMDAMGFQRKICPMIDARREQVYAGLYADNGSEGLICIIPEQLIKANEFLELIEGETVFTGTGAVKYRDIIQRGLTGKGFFVVGHRNRVHASTVGVLAGREALAGGLTDAVKLVPLYLRRSEAEEKMDRQC
ncbi:MAG TPA: tRNA (adenosine(37)-N6)-threonylcarbamoyltransferase complex dimerization subunit type 1 TsaB [Syntrophus sp. (in: bacteria)]|jgi:tRNA threonylcarbamoyladenosine biosynthesis protein TsaB|nr:tRNA (adenosine(37)-N6)-threonylcarbamoyltransferase complex dimerization subunit type 1 TsaB [Syntrophus sp. (in: bacteria)]